MKVAILIDTWFPFVGGGQINALEISKRLAKKGVQLEIITRNNGKEKITYTKNLTITKLGPRSVPENNLSKLRYLAAAFFYVYKNDFDLVHAHAFFPGITARLLMVTKGLPAIFTVHGTSLGTKLNGRIARIVENFILTKVLYSAQITVSQDFLQIKNINKKVFYIPNGYDKFYVGNLKSKKTDQLLCVTRLHPQKNLVNLIKAFKTVAADFPDLILTIAGNGPQKSELVSLIKNLRLTNKVKLIGLASKNELKGRYLSSKLFVLPSLYEGQPLALLEALAAKLPVVVTSTGDIPFTIQDSKNGYLISNPTNPEEIALSIKKALKNRNLSKIGHSGYNSVKNKFTWESAAEKTYKLYEKITKTDS